MMTVFKKKQHSIFMRILLIFLLVFLPLYLISMIVNIMGANNIKDEISKSVLYQTEYYLKNLEDEIIHIFEMQGIYMNDQDFSKLAYLSGAMSSKEKVAYVENIRNKLNMTKLNSKTVKEVKVYFSENNLTYNDSETTGMIDRNELSEIMRTGEFPFVYQKGQGEQEDRLFLNPSGNSLYKREVLPAICFRIELSIPQIEDSLLGFIQYEKGGAVLLNEEQGWAISKSSYRRDGFQIREMLDGKFSANRKDAIGTMEVKGEKFITVYKESSYLKSALLVYIPEDELLGPIEGYRKWIWIISVFAVLEVILFSNWIYRLIRKPLVKLLSAFRKVDEGILDIFIEHKSNDEFQHIYSRFNRMIDKLKVLINQTYEQKILVKNTELKQLQNQINTHFLYNCFFILSRLINFQDHDSAGRLTQHLAAYYQFITRNSFELISLHKEINHAKSYIEIQNFRFSDRISCVLDDVPEDLKEMPVPRLILQPLVENCYKHGLKSKDAGGKILVRIREENGYLYIAVEDNGDELEDIKLEELKRMVSAGNEGNTEVTGLLNIHRRIRIRYGEECGLFFTRSQLGGLCAQLKIPINLQEQDIRSQESAG